LKQSIKPRPPLKSLADGVLQGDRMILSQAITVIESNLADDRKLSTRLLEKIIHATGKSIRIGITGVPGVGKGSFIESFGTHITSLGKKVAVLTVDPSSQITKGSILGDKTRMEGLSRQPLAYIRASPSGSTLGGVAQKTNDVMLLCEAAGYEIVIIETVGVGQSEVGVKNLVDFFLLLMLAGAGDELQGIKKGITEVAHAIVITKADGDNIKNALAAKASYEQALHLTPSTGTAWTPKVLTTSAHTRKGIEEIWQLITSYVDQSTADGTFVSNRQAQNNDLLQIYFQELLALDVARFRPWQSEKEKLQSKVFEKKISVNAAAEKLLRTYQNAIRENGE
jgi:LAO/AO transport system kinase